jgi:hypothetical protein
MAGRGHMAGRKLHASQAEEDYEEEECEMEEGEEEGDEYGDAEEEAEDEESGAGDNDADVDDRIQMSSQPLATQAAAARKTMMSVPLDMSLWNTSWTIIVRPPSLCLYKKATAPTGMPVLDGVGTLCYVALTKKTDPTGKSMPVINLWARKGAVGAVTIRYGVSRKMFMPQEVRDPGARITAGKIKNAPDAVSYHQTTRMICRGVTSIGILQSCIVCVYCAIAFYHEIEYNHDMLVPMK